MLTLVIMVILSGYLGRAGWCVLVDTGSETFWTKADNVHVEGGTPSELLRY
jgi:hypothetical protein